MSLSQFFSIYIPGGQGRGHQEHDAVLHVAAGELGRGGRVEWWTEKKEQDAERGELDGDDDHNEVSWGMGTRLLNVQ